MKVTVDPMAASGYAIASFVLFAAYSYGALTKEQCLIIFVTNWLMSWNSK